LVAQGRKWSVKKETLTPTMPLPGASGALHRKPVMFLNLQEISGKGLRIVL